jgi:ferredoxin
MCLARLSSTQNTNAASLSVKSNPGKSVRGRRELKYVQILSQNTQGFNADKEEIILEASLKRGHRNRGQCNDGRCFSFWLVTVCLDLTD